MKVKIDTTGRVKAIMDPSYIGEQKETTVSRPNESWSPSIIGYGTTQVTKPDPSWERPFAIDADTNKTVYEQKVITIPDNSWSPGQLVVDGKLQYEKHSNDEMIEEGLDPEKDSNIDMSRPIYESDENRPTINRSIDDKSKPVYNDNIEHPTITVEESDISKPIFEDESNRPLEEITEYNNVIPDDVIDVADIPFGFDENTKSYFRFKDGVLNYVGGTTKIKNSVEPILNGLVRQRIIPTIDSLSDSIKSIVADIDMNSNQAIRYRSKYAIAKIYKSGGDISSTMSWFVDEASSKNIDVEDLFTYIITKGDEWSVADSMIDVALDSIRVKLNSRLEEDPYLGYIAYLKISAVDVGSLIKSPETGLTDILDGLAELV